MAVCFVDGMYDHRWPADDPGGAGKRVRHRAGPAVKVYSRCPGKRATKTLDIRPAGHHGYSPRWRESWTGTKKPRR